MQKNAFAMLASGAKAAVEKRKREADSKQASGKRNASAGWKLALLPYLKEPLVSVDLKAAVVETSDTFVVIQDKYPKARVHLLLIPRAAAFSLDAPIAGTANLRKDHIEALRELHEAAMAIGERALEQAGAQGAALRIGYHAVPSLEPLHLHIISQDFDSPCLKNKRHWNSFTTAFFIDASTAVAELEEHGVVQSANAEAEALLKLPMCCCVCKVMCTNMPTLKAHLKAMNCSAPAPGEG